MIWYDLFYSFCGLDFFRYFSTRVLYMDFLFYFGTHHNRICVHGDIECVVTHACDVYCCKGVHPPRPQFFNKCYMSHICGG